MLEDHAGVALLSASHKMKFECVNTSVHEANHDILLQRKPRKSYLMPCVMDISDWEHKNKCKISISVSVRTNLIDIFTGSVRHVGPNKASVVVLAFRWASG